MFFEKLSAKSKKKINESMFMFGFKFEGSN